MDPHRIQAIDLLERFLLVDRSFPPLLHERGFGPRSVDAARGLEWDLVRALPGWRPQTFPRIKGSNQVKALYITWLAAYHAGLDAGMRGQPALVESAHDCHRDRWILAYDVGARVHIG